MADEMYVSQLVMQVEHEEVGNMYVSQLVMQVEYEELPSPPVMRRMRHWKYFEGGIEKPFWGIK